MGKIFVRFVYPTYYIADKRKQYVLADKNWCFRNFARVLKAECAPQHLYSDAPTDRSHSVQ